MCTYPWTNRDMFEFFSTCHIYQPIFIFFNTFTAVLSLILFLYSVHEVKNRKRKDITISAIGLGGFFFLSYTLCLALNLSFANKNMGINILLALGRSCIWINVNFFTLRSLEVVTASDALSLAKFSEVHGSLQTVNWTFCVMNTVVELCGFIIPIQYPSVPQVTLLGILAMLLTLLNASPFVYYAWQLRNVIAVVPVSREFYDPLQKKLEKLCYSALFAELFGVILNVFWIVIPAIHENLYILYSIQMLSGLYFVLQNVQNTKEKANNSTPTKGSMMSGTTHDRDREPTITNRPGSALHMALTTVDSPSPEKEHEMLILEASQRPGSGLDHSSPSTLLPGDESVPIFNPFDKNLGKDDHNVGDDITV